jgi:hypothetical protein
VSFELAEWKERVAELGIAFCNPNDKIITFIELNYYFLVTEDVVLKTAFGV